MIGKPVLLVPNRPNGFREAEWELSHSSNLGPKDQVVMATKESRRSEVHCPGDSMLKELKDYLHKAKYRNGSVGKEPNT